VALAAGTVHAPRRSKNVTEPAVTVKNAEPWRYALLLILGVAAALFFRAYGHAPIEDWRQTDTQAIARHMAEPGASILYPRIDWGGAGKGYVEAEFQLYTWLVGRLLSWFGDAAWPGRLVSLLAMLGALIVTFRGLARRHGDVAALLGVVVLLGSRGVVYVATSVQPEALCLLLFVGAWFAWLEFAETGSRRALLSYGVLGALAMLVKPTAGQLGVASFLLLVLRSRQRLRDPRVWLVWGSMVTALGLHLWHARGVYLEFGNTFGVLSGGDSKVPHLEHLLRPRHYYEAAKNVLFWGTGVVGALALVVALLLRRDSALLVALLASNAFWTVLALRYTSDSAGNHYHILAAVTAAHGAAIVAEAAATKARKQLLRAGMGLLSLLGVVQAVRFFASIQHDPWNAPALAAGAALSEVCPPGELVVVRSIQSSYDPLWRTANNFEDPRVLFYTRTHGWVLSADDFEPRSLEAPLEEGARFYVETVPRPAAPLLDGWLARNAALVRSTPLGGRVFALHR